jgi:RND family efflux transporter MFP subunit
MIAAEAKMKYMKARNLRTEALFAKGRTATEEQRDEAASAAVEAEQAYVDAKAAYDLAVEGPRKEKIGQARALLAKQQALVDQLKDQLNKHTIISRFDGYVIAEHTEIGQWVKKGDLVAEVAALDIVEVVAYVTEQHVPHITVGANVRVEIPALSRPDFPGKVVYVVPQADVRTRTFPVKIRVENEITEEGPLLNSGMYARVMLPTGEPQQALLVPKDALVLGGPQPVVFVVDAINVRQGKAKPVPVELGVASGQLIQVKGALEPGNMVVVEGNERLRPGQDVTIVRTMPIEPTKSSSSP